MTLTYHVGSQGRWPGRDVVAHGALPAPGVLDEGDRNCIVDILVTTERQVSPSAWNRWRSAPGVSGCSARPPGNSQRLSGLLAVFMFALASELEEQPGQRNWHWRERVAQAQ